MAAHGEVFVIHAASRLQPPPGLDGQRRQAAAQVNRLLPPAQLDPSVGQPVDEKQDG